MDMPTTFARPIFNHDNDRQNSQQGATSTFTIAHDRWPTPNIRALSRLTNELNLSQRDAQKLLDEINALDFTVPLPQSYSEIANAEKEALKSVAMQIVDLDIPIPQKNGRSVGRFQGRPEVVFYELWTIVEDLFADPILTDACFWRAKHQGDTESQRVFSELNTGTWWEREQRNLGTNSNILALIFASDETLVTMNGRSVHPVYVTLGNLPNHLRNQASAKRLYGFMPRFLVASGFKNSDLVRRYRRQIRMKSYDILFSPVRQKFYGLAINTSRAPIFVHPRVPFLVLDEKELRYVCGLYNTTKCKRPCNRCLVCPAESSWISSGDARSLDCFRMFASGQLDAVQHKNHSVHTGSNPFLSIPGLDICHLPSCRLHLADHGVFKHLLALCLVWAKKKRVLSMFDERWKHTSNYPFLKTFKDGVSELSMVPAFEHRSMAMQLPFVVHDLCDCSLAEQAATAYSDWRFRFSSESISETEVEEMRAAAERFQHAFVALSQSLSQPTLCSIKLHKLSHTHEDVRRFGMSSNFNGETFESMHKVSVKPAVGHLSFGRDVNVTLIHRDALSYIHRHRIQSPSIASASKNWEVRGLEKPGRLHLRIESALRCAIGNLDFTVHNSLYSSESECYLRVGHDVMFQFASSFGFGRVTLIAKTNRMRCCVLRKFTGTNDGSEFNKSFARLKLIDEYVTIDSCSNATVTIAHIVPDFKNSGHFFLNHMLY
jgi:hypothetical protein